ncbi:calcium uptake protein 3, mitochondrial-like isoform X2 [Amphibalanus amphitrite]|uniref:calcium uptake protein 3, mitochondrial-like isoform X2 n=1 Tax=Amphibalanus amphitrite TaxID=1232801 RepID=UPI001C919805|nr:calcium uptake protein 3, mitochondrial-like isoform X2 [Amphibalanus amphitrite]
MATWGGVRYMKSWLHFFRKCEGSASRTFKMVGGTPLTGKLLLVPAILTSSALCYLAARRHKFGAVYALKRQKDVLESSALKLTSRERRFIKFASVEHQGQLYMTTQDFIESITEAEPRPRLKRRILLPRDLDHFYAVTPRASKSTTHMFRDLHDTGIISYTEYLFLLSVLTKPATGFRIAFNMFDTDGNERVSRTEFLVILRLMALNMLEELRVTLSDEEDYQRTRAALEKIFSHARRERRGSGGATDAEDVHLVRRALTKEDALFAPCSDEDVEDDILQHKKKVNTTLLVHFFGPKGDHELSYDEFKQFMENLQEEVLEIEFQEFAKGYHKISEVEFAKILLRYTYLRPDQYDLYIDRLVERMEETSLRGVTFEEFRDFCSFLNQLEDFAIAMRMYTMADQPISQEEFHRAVRICTGKALSDHVVDTVFCIFDEDGDGQLSYKEFIGFMKERRQRGFKTTPRTTGWQAFKYCVKQEMRTST